MTSHWVIRGMRRVASYGAWHGWERIGFWDMAAVHQSVIRSKQFCRKGKALSALMLTARDALKQW